MDGWAASQGLPELGKFTLPRFCNLVWYWYTKDGDQKDVDKFEAQLYRPPVGVQAPAVGPWSAEAEMAAFRSMKAALGQ